MKHIKLIVLLLTILFAITVMCMADVNTSIFFHVIQDKEVIDINIRWHTSKRIEYGKYGVHYKTVQDYLKEHNMPCTVADARSVMPLIHIDVARWQFRRLLRATQGNVYLMFHMWNNGMYCSSTKSSYADEAFALYNCFLKNKGEK